MGVTMRKTGRHFFANPGPTNIPESVLRAMDRGSMDFVESEFLEIFDQARAGLQRLLFTEHEIFFYASTGHGAWEATMANLFSAGDKVLMIGGGYFSTTWAALSRGFGIEAEIFEVEWHLGADMAALQARLAADTAHAIKAVCVVHNETSTSVVLPLQEIRAALDAANHPALYLADTISSLGCFEFRMDAWGIDAVVGGSQKGLMLPAGMAFTAVGPKALAAHAHAKLPRFYFDWTAMLTRRYRSFTGTVPVVPFFGLVESLRLLEQEGIENVWARHRRLGGAVRAAVRAWGTGNQGPELYCRDPSRYSDSVTAVQAPEGHNADTMRKILLDRYNVSSGGGLSSLSGQVFRIGHMGDLNEAMILGTLATVELAMADAGMPFAKGGVQAAIEALRE
ncbi:MAG: serine--glyoxylate aminotransferase [Rhodospirillales bacterium 20-64-7]|nr:MAG: serine--glyoxylate aminotransferase [Rhodospirillales bacterium 20-64-7]